ncbi:hypothetical protein RvY_09689, partial [Ramazzottius varieornatus]
LKSVKSFLQSSAQLRFDWQWRPLRRSSLSLSILIQDSNKEAISLETCHHSSHKKLSRNTLERIFRILRKPQVRYDPPQLNTLFSFVLCINSIIPTIQR